MIVGAAESVLSQCRPEDEIIVIDDGSTDDTEGVLRPFADRIRYVKTGNAGAGNARNRGIREARNDLIAFLDSDDEWMPGKLDLQRGLLEARPDILYTFSDFAVKYPDGRENRNYLIHWHRDRRNWDDILAPGVPFSEIASLPDGFEDFQVHIGSMYRPMANALYLCTDTVVARREAAGDSLVFDPDIPRYEDWACFGRLAGAGTGAYLNVETAYQLGHTGNRLTDADELATAEARIVVLEKVWGQDDDFLAEHGDYYRTILGGQRIIRARELLARGLSAPARQELARVAGPPLKLRILAVFPGWSIRILLRLRSLVKKLFAGR
jgi:glycosyltransferase involved in cell wall biosynthesis